MYVFTIYTYLANTRLKVLDHSGSYKLQQRPPQVDCIDDCPGLAVNTIRCYLHPVKLSSI